MSFSRGILSVLSRRLLLGVCGAALLGSSGCSPDEVQAPPSEIEAAEAPAGGLVGEWKLDETSGTTAADTKNGYNASVHGGAAFVAGTLGNALDLNNGNAGTGGKYAQMPSNATLDNVQEGNYTISAWFYPYTIPTDATFDNRHWTIVAKAGQAMGIVLNDAGKFSARHYLSGNVLEVAQGNTVYPAGAWYHVAGTVSRTGGTVKIYVNGVFQDQTSFLPNTAAREYGTTRFQIGKSGSYWAANGKVDQVRIYNRELSDSEIADLHEETEGLALRFPVGMFKGPQIEFLGMDHTPDGYVSATGVNGVRTMLDTARARGVRVVIRVTGGNPGTDPNNDPPFVLQDWKDAFDPVSGMDLNQYLTDGTLIGHYAIDEPFADFSNMNSGFLEDICEYQKSFPGWSQVPCIIRETNKKLHDTAPTGGYQFVDAGWAQLAHQHYMPASTYDGDMGAYFRDNLAKGDLVGLGLIYGFNLFNGRRVPNCERPDGDDIRCAMTAAEVREVADTIAAIGNDQGCGVIGYRIDPNPGLERDYFFGQGTYSGNGIQSALQYLNSQVGDLQPGSCS